MRSVTYKNRTEIWGDFKTFWVELLPWKITKLIYLNIQVPWILLIVSYLLSWFNHPVLKLLFSGRPLGPAQKTNNLEFKFLAHFCCNYGFNRCCEPVQRSYSQWLEVYIPSSWWFPGTGWNNPKIGSAAQLWYLCWQGCPDPSLTFEWTKLQALDHRRVACIDRHWLL